MALIFPTSASLNDTYQSGSSATYKWNGTYWIVSAPVQTGLTVSTASYSERAAFVQADAPGTGTGSLWYSTETGNTYVKVGTQWAPATNGTINSVSASFALSSSRAVTASYAISAGKMITGSVTITGTGGNPTKGSTTVDKIILIDDGSGLCTLTMNYYQSTAGTAGSGDYLFTLPGGYQFDTSFHSAFAVTGDPQLSGNESWIPGSSGKVTSVASSLMAVGYAQVWDATRFRILEGSEILYGSNINFRTPISATFYSMGTTGAGYQMSFTFKKL